MSNAAEDTPGMTNGSHNENLIINTLMKTTRTKHFTKEDLFWPVHNVSLLAEFVLTSVEFRSVHVVVGAHMLQ